MSCGGSCLFPSPPFPSLRAFRAFLPDEAGAGGGCSSWHWLRGARSGRGRCGQQIFPVLITMEVIRASARPRHGSWMWSQQHQQLLDKHQPEPEKHQPACDLRLRRGPRVQCMYFHIYMYII